MRAFWPTLLRLALLFALAASAALAVDYLSSNPSFCSGTSGCGEVRRSGWGYVGRMPVPALGVLAFAAVLSLSLASPALRRLGAYATIAGALIASALIVVQALVIRTFCWLCLVVDVAAIVAGAAAVALVVPRRQVSAATEAEHEPLARWAWGVLAALAVAAPMLWPAFRPAGELPAGVRERYVPGKINVVEFVDFECPFCRMFHPTLKKVVSEYGDRVNFVRLDLPLDSHPHARGAAKAHLCAEEQRAGDAMAEALFETEDLGHEGLVAVAKKLDLDLARFERCLAAPETEKKLVAVESILRDSGMLQGLPTTFVGNAMLVGAQDDVALRDAFERAARGGGGGGIPGYAYLALVFALAGLVAWAGRAKGAAVTSRSA